LPLRIRALLGLNPDAKQIADAVKSGTAAGCGTGCGSSTTKQHA
jgi:hypothetical protein